MSSRKGQPRPAAGGGDRGLSFGAEEEIEGPCCAEIVSFLKERGVWPDFVLDEGGAVIPEGLPGIRGEAAMIAVAEKGVANFSVSIASGEGGHAATPPKSTVAGRLARAWRRVSRVAPAVNERRPSLFARARRHSRVAGRVRGSCADSHGGRGAPR